MPGSKTVQSLDRGLMILEAVAASDDGLSLSELSDVVGLKSTTVHNLARTLLERNYLAKTSRPTRYRIGGALSVINETTYQRTLIRQAEHAVRAVYTQLNNATVTFCEPVGSQVLMLLRMSHDRGGLLERPRRTMHSYGSATALVMQAFWSEEERTAFRTDHPFWEHGQHLWGSLDKLDAYLATVRRAGVAVPMVKENNLFLVSAPVFGSGRQLVGALGLNLGTIEEIDKPTRQKAIDLITDHAHELSSSQQN